MRLLDQPHNLCQRRVGANARGPHREGALPVEGSAGHLVALALGDGHALAGEHCFIHPRFPADHLAVYGDLLPRAHEHHIAHAHRCNRDLLRLTIPEELRGLRLQTHQRLDGGAGLALRARFQPATEQDQRHDDRRGLEIQRGMCCERPLLGDSHRQRVDAVAVGSGRAERNQRVHVGGKMACQPSGRRKELPAAREDDNRRQRHFDQGTAGKAQHEHTQRQHRHGEERSDDE